MINLEIIDGIQYWVISDHGHPFAFNKNAIYILHKYSLEFSIDINNDKWMTRILLDSSLDEDQVRQIEEDEIQPLILLQELADG